MKLLLHICCSNCAVYPVTRLREGGFSLKGFWFNPNIHPEPEYASRLGSLKRLQALWGLDILYRDLYGLDQFVKALGENTAEGARCAVCYRLRLEEAAAEAKRLKMDAFTTTLLVSPYQKFDIITAEAARVESTYNIPFHYEDFRPGFREGMKTAGGLGLYRQKHCGCTFSAMEAVRRRAEKKAHSPG
ncbi:MAG: epoxyqueuosine reductase QueH [Nitrospiraceae bacterium]|nr:epoxyqueuosine reductase QueH [Nitrospiraceae bacterium]